MPKPALNSSLLRSRFKLKNLQSESILRSHHPHAIAQLEAAGVKPGSLRAHAAKLLSAGAVAGSLMISSPSSLPALAALPPSAHSSAPTSSTNHQELVDHLAPLLPVSPGHLDSVSETKVSELLHQRFGVHAYPELEGNRLNHSFGLVGAEQHLPRFPGDAAWEHGNFIQSGITPGRGAWGYFANSREEITPDLIAKEKYYFAVQTLYLPDWTTRLSYLRDWYKYRKVIAVNPKNGKVLVGVIADSGPAQFTGKHFGGSPEVMNYLDLKDGKQRGSVILYFVDDPTDSVPLGPLEYNLENPPLLVSS